MRLPQGFSCAGIAAGLKPSGRPDLGVILAAEGAAWAFSGTTNTLRAACVDRNRALSASGQSVRAIVVNAGNANCATGEQGARDNDEYAQAVAGALGIPTAEGVLTASTGVVGRPLPLDRIRSALPELAAALGGEIEPFSRAILTTDTVPKVVELELPGGARIVGAAKGSGMIHPNMATMLAFVLTDAAVDAVGLRGMWPGIVARSFNQVTVDGDTSPNDMAMVLASGRVPCEANALADGLQRVCAELARMIARDGEGATRLLTVAVTGARSDEEARAAARTVAGSPLVKAAVHGRDPNWGRILVALGRSSAAFDPTRVEITLQGTGVYRHAPLEFDAAAVSRALDAADVTIAIDLGAGDGAGEAWGCDLSAEYVRINADYTT